MDRYYSYDEISLVPRMSNCESRATIDTSIEFLGRKFNLPIVPANMKCTIDASIAKTLSEQGYFYIMHRFEHDQLQFVKTANEENWKNISISIGIKTEDLHLLAAIRDNKLRIDYLTIDVAHGHHSKVVNIISELRKRAEFNNIKIIAGNVATADGAKSLIDAGADAIKVGIGQGMACTTKDKTGFTLPMYTCVDNIFKEIKKVPIIADGGIRCNGDIAKAIVAGATMVMAGGIFAGCIDSPSNAIIIDGKKHKEYYGSASFHNKGHSNNIEGAMVPIVCNGMSYDEKLSEIKQDLQSAMSYAGVRNLEYNSAIEMNQMQLLTKVVAIK